MNSTERLQVSLIREVRECGQVNMSRVDDLFAARAELMHCMKYCPVISQYRSSAMSLTAVLQTTGSRVIT